MAAEQPSLSKLVGTRILAKIPLWNANKMMSLHLVGVEPGGIWVENNEFMETFLAGTEHKMTQQTMQIFVPFAQILAIYAMGGGPWISEKVAR